METARIILILGFAVAYVQGKGVDLSTARGGNVVDGNSAVKIVDPAMTANNINRDPKIVWPAQSVNANLNPGQGLDQGTKVNAGANGNVNGNTVDLGTVRGGNVVDGNGAVKFIDPAKSAENINRDPKIVWPAQSVNANLNQGQGLHQDTKVNAGANGNVNSNAVDLGTVRGGNVMDGNGAVTFIDPAKSAENINRDPKIVWPAQSVNANLNQGQGLDQDTKVNADTNGNVNGNTIDLGTVRGGNVVDGNGGVQFIDPVMADEHISPDPKIVWPAQSVNANLNQGEGMDQGTKVNAGANGNVNGNTIDLGTVRGGNVVDGNGAVKFIDPAKSAENINREPKIVWPAQPVNANLNPGQGLDQGTNVNSGANGNVNGNVVDLGAVRGGNVVDGNEVNAAVLGGNGAVQFIDPSMAADNIYQEPNIAWQAPSVNANLNQGLGQHQDTKVNADANGNVNVKVQQTQQAGQAASVAGGQAGNVNQNQVNSQGQSVTVNVQNNPVEIVEHNGELCIHDKVKNTFIVLRVHSSLPERRYTYVQPQVSTVINTREVLQQLIQNDEINTPYLVNFFKTYGTTPRTPNPIEGLGSMDIGIAPWLQACVTGTWGPQYIQVQTNIRSNLCVKLRDLIDESLSDHQGQYDYNGLADYLCERIQGNIRFLPPQLSNFACGTYKDVHFITDDSKLLSGIIPNTCGSYFQQYPDILCVGFLVNVVGNLVFRVVFTVVNLLHGILTVVNHLVFGLTGVFGGHVFGVLPGLICGGHVNNELGQQELLSFLGSNGGLNLNGLNVGGLLDGLPVVGGSHGLLTGVGLSGLIASLLSHPTAIVEVVSHKAGCVVPTALQLTHGFLPLGGGTLSTTVRDQHTEILGGLPLVGGSGGGLSLAGLAGGLPLLGGSTRGSAGGLPLGILGGGLPLGALDGGLPLGLLH